MEPSSPTKHHSFWESTVCAFAGIRAAYVTERNLRIDTVITLVVGAAAAFLGLPASQVPLVLLAIGLVAGAELLNTAIESAVDLAHPDLHPIARRAKDIAAAGVMVTAVTAGSVGVWLFAPLVMRFIAGPPALSEAEIFTGMAFVVATLLFVAWWVANPVDISSDGVVTPVRTYGDNRKGEL